MPTGKLCGEGVGASSGVNRGRQLLCGACPYATPGGRRTLAGLLARAHTPHTGTDTQGWDSASSAALGRGGAGSLLRLVLPTLRLHLGEDALIEQEVGAGGQHLLQAGLADSVVGDPQPLAAGGDRVLG